MNTLSNEKDKISIDLIPEVLLNIASKLLDGEVNEVTINNLKTTLGDDFKANCSLLSHTYDLGLKILSNIPLIKLLLVNKADLEIQNNSAKLASMRSGGGSSGNDLNSVNKWTEDYYNNQISILLKIAENIKNKRHILYVNPPTKDDFLSDLKDIGLIESDLEAMGTDIDKVFAENKETYRLEIDHQFCDFLNEKLKVIITLEDVGLARNIINRYTETIQNSSTPVNTEIFDLKKSQHKEAIQVKTREEEIICYIQKGLTLKQIALGLNITYGSLGKNEMPQIYNKYGITKKYQKFRKLQNILKSMI